MDLTSLIVAAQRPRPDNPPVHMRRAPVMPKRHGPPGYVTRFVKGRWVLVPINGGTSDPALAPHITVTPIRRRVA